MYISKLNTHTNYKLRLHNANKKDSVCMNNRLQCDCVTFCHSQPTLKQRTSKLVKSYMDNFGTQTTGFLLDGNASLQPSEIPMTTLSAIAEKELEKMQKFPKNHILYIITGRIGGGKTTYIKNNNLQDSFYIPDADEIKPLLPGYKEKGATYVHRASCLINSANLTEALKRGINTIIQTSTTIENIYDIIDEARDYKYNDITMVHIDTSEETAIKRSQERGKLTGRKIDPNIIRERKYIDDIVPTFQTPLKGLSKLIVYNNNGETPIKTEDIDFVLPQILTYVTESSD